MSNSIKGTIMGYKYENWKQDKDILSSILISVMETWEWDCFNHIDKKFSSNLYREYGKIKNAHSGFMNDIHNLAIAWDMLESALNNKSLEFGKKLLNITLLMEMYFTNLRSIYDFTSYFPKLLIEEKNLTHLPSKKEGSVKELIKYFKKESAKEIISQEIIDVIIECEENLDNIRKIRDLIIHKGKELLLFFDNSGEVKISFSNKNLLPNILNEECQAYDLKKYLRKITNNTFEYIEKLGYAMYNEILKKNTNYKIYLCALTGVCIPNFIEYLGWKD